MPQWSVPFASASVTPTHDRGQSNRPSRGMSRPPPRVEDITLCFLDRVLVLPCLDSCLHSPPSAKFPDRGSSMRRGKGKKSLAAGREEKQRHVSEVSNTFWRSSCIPPLDSDDDDDACVFGGCFCGRGGMGEGCSSTRRITTVRTCFFLVMRGILLFPPAHFPLHPGCDGVWCSHALRHVLGVG
jgi:hypothetical protein